MRDRFKIALCQMNVADDKKKNLEKAAEMIGVSAENNCGMAVLPEMFNCPYDSSKFATYAEAAETGETARFISGISKKHGIYVVAGSIPETEGGKLYNTSLIFDGNGQIIAKHRKMHMFDIDVKGKITFRESDALTPGNGITVVDTGLCRIGVAICFDIRFPELIRLMALKGAKLIVVPAAFNMVTGPAHWELTVRARALDNQVYMAVVSPARNESANYVAYGNSMAADPWGTAVARAGTGEEIVYADIDIGFVDRLRNELPLLKNRRTDVYQINEKGITE